MGITKRIDDIIDSRAGRNHIRDDTTLEYSQI